VLGIPAVSWLAGLSGFTAKQRAASGGLTSAR